MKIVATVFALGAVGATLAACDAGNYSNEDLDFQLAVPERDQFRPPQSARDATASKIPWTRRSASWSRHGRATPSRPAIRSSSSIIAIVRVSTPRSR